MCVSDLFDLSGKHTAFNAQYGGNVDVFFTDAVDPHSQALQSGQEQHPGKLDDVENPFNNVVCEKEGASLYLNSCGDIWIFRNLQ